jgi:NAD/NADP transhydrogenase alpha subunit
MPLLPSLYRSDEGERAWSVTHAAVYGAVIGVLAAVFKIFGPQHVTAGLADLPATLALVAVAGLGFALLCAGAAALRNLIARHLLWHESGP